MADGLRTAIGVHGPLPRNTPTLYNVGAKQRLFWDRRAPSLEVQVFGPLFDPEEMAADPGELVARLQAISAYREHFARAFPAESEDSAVSLENVARALAAFERSLVSRSSRYDRWAAGERAALSAAEKRGLRTFRSVNTRCFECHIPPTFAAPLSLSIGVPGDDPGVGGISGHEAQRGQFGVPTLRNIGVSAPYMHDGSIATLEEVLDFYREGGGRARGVPGSRVNGHVRAFDISDVEAAELVAFLRALTDESARPEIPDAVPSGLPIFRPQPAPLLRMRTEALP
jgi:cytochrome c peroxidase